MVTTLSAAWVVAVPAYFPMNAIGFGFGFGTAVAAAETIISASNATARIESFFTVCPFRWSQVMGLIVVALRGTSIGAAAVRLCGKAPIVKGASYGLPPGVPTPAGATLRALRGVSSAGRAPPLQGGGRRFDPGTLHFSY